MGFDIAIGIFLLLGAARGFKKGFARQVLTISSLALAFLFARSVANRLSPLLADQLEKFPKLVADSLLFTGSLLLIFVLVNGMGTLYLYVYRTRSLGVNVPSVQDRVVGIGMGIVVAAFVACVLISQYSRLPTLITGSDMMQTHYKSSRAIKLAEEHQIAKKVWDTKEVQQAYTHAARLVEYFRPDSETAAELTKKISE